jgi:4-diphosphocytidyl-2-C-methyl-D-erythritol kinase
MQFSAEKIPCNAKLNLTLRVTGKRLSGFHDLCSVFLRVGPTDYLTIKAAEEDNVSVNFKIKKSVITGRNILLKTLDKLRADGIRVPPLNMILEKSIPPGTGMGAGSGDAAGLLTFLGRTYSFRGDAAQFGSDVPFLNGASRLALVEGIGEKIKCLDDSFLNLKAAAVIPSWRCNTVEMYRRLDCYYGGRWPVSREQAVKESERVLDMLRQRRYCGLLPNDFAPLLMKEHSEYQDLFDAAAACGALAWGITGSGSAAFALWNLEDYRNFAPEFPWVENVFIF